MRHSQTLRTGVRETGARIGAKLFDSGRSLKALLISETSPHAMALGLALGIFMATTPFLGLQVCGAMGLAWLFGASVPAAVLGTFWANPVTCPLLWMASYRLGAAVLAIDERTQKSQLVENLNAAVTTLFAPGWASLHHAIELLWPLAKPLTLGSLLLGLIFAGLGYCAARRFLGVMKLRASTA